MILVSTWRQERPGLWLSAALAADLIAYATDAQMSFGTIVWVALDIWLAHRVWKRGATALTWFRGLQVVGLCLFGPSVVLAHWQDNFETGATVGTVLLYALSVWFLMASALTNHVASPAAASNSPREAEPSPSNR